MKARSIVSVILLALAVVVGTPSMAQEPVQCEANYTVQASDWLSKIADSYYGDYSLYPAIIFATNARSIVGDGYATIANPNLIMPGWKLCIPSAETARGALTVDVLRNAEYKSEWTKSKTAQLTGGEYEEEIVPGSATEIRIKLTSHMAFGYLSDGQEVAAAVLVTDPGGSGTFYDLAAVVQKDGEPVNIATTLLGDRIRINSLSIKGGEIAVDMIAQGPDDPFCCPTQWVVQTYALRGEQLVQISSKAIGTAQPSGEETAAFSLEGPHWRLVSYVSSQGSPVSVLANTEIWVESQSGQFTGNAGCNNYFGSYGVEGDGLSFGPIGSSMMACGHPEGMMKQETDYLTALGRAASYRIVGDQLQIVDAEGNLLLTFQIVEPVPLVGTTWQLRFYNDGKGALASVLAGTQTTAIFGNGGSLTGSAGCNTYKASYEVGDGALTIGPLATTRMMCAEPEGIMEQERAYLAALESTTAHKIMGDTLELTSADGARVATYAKAAGVDIMGVLWKWERTQTPVGVTAVDDPDKYTLKLLSDGKVHIRADCNTGSGTYEIDGSHVSIEITALTLAACPEGSLGDQFIKDINAAVIYFIEDASLFIDLKFDSGTMKFVR